MALPVSPSLSAEIPVPCTARMVGQKVHNCIQVFCGRLGRDVVELNVQPDHAHLICMEPPKASISDLMATVKGLGQRYEYSNSSHISREGPTGATTFGLRATVLTQ